MRYRKKTGFDSAKTAQAVRKLEAVRIIRKDVPFLNEKNRKLNQYIIQDGMLCFWFRFVAKGTDAIERTYGNEYYAAMVRPYIHEFMGAAFQIGSLYAHRVIHSAAVLVSIDSLYSI